MTRPLSVRAQALCGALAALGDAWDRSPWPDGAEWPPSRGFIEPLVRIGRPGAAEAAPTGRDVIARWSVWARPGQRKGAVLLSEAGAGRTWSLSWTAAALARQQAESLANGWLAADQVQLPVYLDLTTLGLAAEDPGLGGLLVRACAEREPGDLRRLLPEAARRHRLLLILDGLDQVPAVGKARANLGTLLQELEREDVGTVILSCRIAAWPDYDNDHLVPRSWRQTGQLASLLPWSHWRVRDHLASRLKGEDPRILPELLGMLDADPELAEACRVPLFLHFLEQLSRIPHGLPPRHGALQGPRLHRAFVHLLLEGRQREGGLTQQWHREPQAVELVADFLEPVAWRLFQLGDSLRQELGDRRWFDLPAWLSACQRVAPAPGDGGLPLPVTAPGGTGPSVLTPHELLEGCLEAGLLQRHGAGYYSFAHPAVADGLAARGMRRDPEAVAGLLADAPECRRDRRGQLPLVDRWGQMQWLAPWRFRPECEPLLANWFQQLSDDQAAAQREALQHEPPDCFGSLTVWRANLLSSRSEAPWPSAAVDDLAAELQVWLTRQAGLSFPLALARLRMLRGPLWERLRRRLAASLGEGGQAAAPRRVEAARAAGLACAYAGPQARELLDELRDRLLDQREVLAVRAAAAWALERAAALTEGRLANIPAALRQLLERAGDDERLRAGCARSLGLLAPLCGPELQPTIDALASVWTARNSPERLRGQAAEALAAACAASAADPARIRRALLQVFGDGAESRNLRCLAATRLASPALGSGPGAAEIIAAMLPVLRDSSEPSQVRGDTARALGHFLRHPAADPGDTEEVLNALTEALADPAEADAVRASAATALGGTAPDSPFAATSVQALLRTLGDEQAKPELRGTAAEALGNACRRGGATTPRILEELLPALTNRANHDVVRRRVASALATAVEGPATRRPPVVDALQRILLDPRNTPVLRAHCLSALVGACDPDTPDGTRILHRVMLLLGDSGEHSLVREQAATSLGMAAARPLAAGAAAKITDGLVRAFGNRQNAPSVRQAAVRALARSTATLASADPQPVIDLLLETAADNTASREMRSATIEALAVASRRAGPRIREVLRILWAAGREGLAPGIDLPRILRERADDHRLIVAEDPAGGIVFRD